MALPKTKLVFPYFLSKWCAFALPDQRIDCIIMILADAVLFLVF